MMRPRRFLYPLVSYFTLAALLVSCGEHEDAAAQHALADVAEYRSWPLRREIVQSAGGHGGTATVYANTVVANYLATAAPGGATDVTLRYPEGAILVKDLFMPDGSLKYVAIMRKTAETPAGAAEYGGWVWSQRATPGAVDAWKTGADCLDCHNRANADTFHDGVFVFPACSGDVECK